MHINLLPYRETLIKRRKARFVFHMGLAVALGVTCGGLIFVYLQQQLSWQQSRNFELKAELGRLDKQIKEIADLKTNITNLETRRNAVEDLQADRNLSVHMLRDLARHVPNGVVLKAVKQADQQLVLTGAAQSQESVSEFLRNLGKSAVSLHSPELIEVTAATAVNKNSKEEVRFFNFSIKTQLRRLVSP